MASSALGPTRVDGRRSRSPDEPTGRSSPVGGHTIRRNEGLTSADVESGGRGRVTTGGSGGRRLGRRCQGCWSGSSCLGCWVGVKSKNRGGSGRFRLARRARCPGVSLVRVMSRSFPFVASSGTRTDLIDAVRWLATQREPVHCHVGHRYRRGRSSRPDKDATHRGVTVPRGRWHKARGERVAAFEGPAHNPTRGALRDRDLHTLADVGMARYPRLGTVLSGMGHVSLLSRGLLHVKLPPLGRSASDGGDVHFGQVGVRGPIPTAPLWNPAPEARRRTVHRPLLA